MFLIISLSFARGNEIVSHTLAKDNDVWFHARGVPGAHVLLRCAAAGAAHLFAHLCAHFSIADALRLCRCSVPSGREAAPAEMQFAADLAAHYSR
jgi:predicted ribosome quality control (RQC) complex YloA/Tae2 family protein